MSILNFTLSNIRRCIFLIVLSGILFSCAQNQPKTDVLYSQIAKIELGEALFQETALSNNGTSCITCHKPTLAFADTGKNSITYIDSIFGNRNSPSLLYAGLKSSYFPEGGGKNLESVSIAPLLNIHEMNTNFRKTQASLKVKGYQKLFNEAFAQDTITNQNIARALAAYIKSLNPFQSKFDKHKQAILSSSDYKIFQAKCGNCHSGNLFTNQQFYTTHLSKAIIPGRFLLTGNPSDSNLVQVKSLRNVLSTPPYMFNGSLNTMQAVFVFYEETGRAASNKGQREKIPLSTLEKNAILRFLNNLEEEYPE